tara:strand:+ start:452 stop:2944 length:2493 start_codon:yes stop_codon:yes gene_type:complete
MATGQDKRLDQEQRLGAQITENKQSLKELLRLRKDIEASGKKDAALNSKIAKLQKQINSDTIRYRNVKKQIAEYTKKDMEFSEMITDYASEMSKTLQKQLPSIKKQAEFTGGISSRTKEAVTHAKRALQHAGPLGDMYGQSAINLKSMNENELELLKNQENVGTSLYDNTTLEQSLADAKENLANLENMYANNKDKMHHKSRRAIEETIERQKAQIDYQDKLNTKNEIANEQINAASEYVGGLFDTWRNSMQMLPGGSLLSSFVLPEVVLKNFKEKVGGIFSAMHKGTMDTGDAMNALSKEGVKVLETAFKSLGATFGGIKIVPTLLSAIGLFKILSKSAEYIRERTDEIGESMGAIGVLEYGAQIRAATNDIMDLGYGTQDVLNLSTKLTGEWGFAKKDAINMSHSIAEVAKSTGIAIDESAELTGMFTTFHGLSMRQTEEFLKQGAHFAYMQGVAPEAVMRDIAASADLVATYTKGGADNIFKMSVSAKKLGMEMKDLDSIARGLLDIESSMNAEMELAALTGKSFNLTRARQMALDEDWEGLQKELTAQFGDQNFWQNATRIEKELMSDILQTDVKTMGKIVSGEKERLTLGKALQGTVSLDDLLGKNAISRISELSNKMKKMAAMMWETFGPVLEWVAGIFVTFFEYLEETPLAMAGVRGALVALMIAMSAFTMKGIISLFVMAGKLAGMAAGALGPAGPVAFPLILTGLTATIWSMLSEASSAGSGYSQMAEGGVVEAIPGGHKSIIGEAGKPEAVIPLNTPAADKYLGGGSDKAFEEMKHQNSQIIQILANTQKTLHDALGPQGDLPQKIAKKDPFNRVFSRGM